MDNKYVTLDMEKKKHLRVDMMQRKEELKSRKSLDFRAQSLSGVFS